MTLDAQHFGNHLKFLARLTKHSQAHSTANVRQLPRQVNQCAFGSDVLGGSFSNDMCTARFIPLSLYLETGEVTWSRAIVCFDSGHVGASYSSSALGLNEVSTGSDSDRLHTCLKSTGRPGRYRSRY